ncbi:MAG TPA: methyltransferase [Alphaproteobacteria bacterium]|nr:methyltransferase [Alphaproteobacteria bacterium]
MSGETAATEDTLLGGRVHLAQPAEGYRAAIDPVLLAAAVAAGPRDRVLDAGAGVGATSLCLAARVAQCRIVGVERDPALVALFRHNIAANGWNDRITALAGDIAAPPPALEAGSFDRVMINPPYLAAAAADAPPHPGRAAAMVEGAADLAAWLEFGLAMLRRKGTLTVIHRADRLDALLAALYGRAGDVAILPFWPKAGQAARRVVVAARKAVAGPARLLPGLVLHEADGAYSAAAEAVLRAGAGLDLAG